MSFWKKLHFGFIGIVLLSFAVLLFTGTIESTLRWAIARYGLTTITIVGFIAYFFFYPLFDFGGGGGATSSGSSSSSSSAGRPASAPPPTGGPIGTEDSSPVGPGDADGGD